ncbi:unnamed protein product [Urochloa decumbens]|uniref:VQ domain-containing protein n=1 Tax=Urochloa decumbens TaxID=240449 RepID=A0ABC9BX12_9POAL
MEPSSSSATTTSSSSPSSHRSGGRELQGPRPAPLRVRKDSHKIRKQPVQQVREPVIIYTVSPKVVHAQPSEFMSVVQRLTGTAAAAAAASSSLPAPAPPLHHRIIPTTSSLFFGGAAPSSSSAALQYPPPAPHFPFQLPQYQPGGPHELSPAARLAAIEQAARSSGGAAGGLMMPPFPGILSPGSLPAIQQASFFSPPPPGAGINLFGELISPAVAFLGGPAPAAGTTSSSTAAATQLQLAAAGHQNLMMLQQEASPSAAGAYYWGNLDLFNNQHDHQN